jgi:hypothetical protein
LKGESKMDQPVDDTSVCRCCQGTGVSRVDLPNPCEEKITKLEADLAKAEKERGEAHEAGRAHQAKLELAGQDRFLESVPHSAREASKKIRAMQGSSDNATRRAEKAEAELRDQTARAETACGEQTLAINELDNAGEGRGSDGEQRRVHHGIQALSKRAHDAERRYVTAEAEVERLKEPKLARHQPCGCVMCVCEDPVKCHGCGAKNCGTHPGGEIPHPVYETHPLMAENAELRGALEYVDTEFRAYEAEREGEESVFGEIWERVKAALRSEHHEPEEVGVEVEELDEDEEVRKALMLDIAAAAIEETAAETARVEAAAAADKLSADTSDRGRDRFAEAQAIQSAATQDRIIAAARRREAVERLGE